jgi:hypothetical protein
MRIEKLILELKAKQFTVMETTFKSPPQNYEAFVKQLGVWIGVGECLRIIEDARKKDTDDE